MSRKKCKFLLWMVLIVLGLFLQQPVEMKAEDACYEITSSNVESQDYTVRSNPIHSYLSHNGQMIMRVQGPEKGSTDSRILVEYYDLNYQFIRQKTVAGELPIFGGFYETENNYYILSGQANPNEDDSIEVFRITKYDKNWNRIRSVGLYGANTTEPFRAGSVRMADDGEYLIIRTAHAMYSGNDSAIHQANVNIQVKMDTMEITDAFTGVWNVNGGYVSHSFNQFVAIDNGSIVALDHGDANPRSLVLIKYNTKVASGSFFRNDCDYTDVISFSGEIGDNETGASVGGFEVNESKYLIAGNYVGDGNELDRETRNIFVASVSKDLTATKIDWITNYTDGTVSTPHLVSIGNKEYMLLWSRENQVYYTKINQEGQKVGNIYSLSGALSDCVPILVSGKLVWYTAESDELYFYQINCTDLNDVKISKGVNGHAYEKKDTANGYANLTCSRCGKMQKVKLPTKIYVAWRVGDSGSYRVGMLPEENLEIGEKLCYLYLTNSSDSQETVNQEYIVEVSDSSVLVFDKRKQCFTAKKDGIVTVTFKSKYDSSVSVSYIICTGDVEPVEMIRFEMDNISLNESETKQLKVDVSPSNATNKSVTFTSSDSSIATVSETGLVTAKKGGSVTITATACDGTGVSGSCKVLVRTSLEKASITLSATSYVYDGTAKQPTVTVKLGNKTLTSGTDYTVTYTKNTAVGTATVSITGKGNYAGTASKTYTITAATIKDAKVTLSSTSYNYNGKERKPSVTVMLGDKKLDKNNYSVTYKDNKNIGTATVTIKGKGNYTGTVTQKFKIKLDKGKVFTSGKYKYKVTGDSTVAFNGIASTKTTKVSIPKTIKYGGKTFKVTSVADKALKGKTKVTQITIGENVTKIGTSAFEGCTKLSKVTMGANVTTIGKSAFKNCTALKSITIPSKVTKIDKQAFYGCKNLKTITIKSTKLKTVGKEAFKKINSKATIKVPKKKLSSYKKLLKGKGQGSKVKIVKY